MKTYEYYGSSPDGWNVSGTLELEDDGQFGYSEGWTDYTNASLSGGAAGTWRREGNVLLFRVEKVYTPLYFPWASWSVLRAVERGDELDFGDGWTMSEPGEHVIRVLVHNRGERPLAVRLEPWGRDQVLGPGGRLHIVGRGPYSWLKHKVERGDDEVVYHGWPGSRAEVEYEPKPPAPPKPTPPPPTVKPPPAPEVELPPEPPPYVPPRVNPFNIPPALAARLRGWIDEMDTEGFGNWVRRLSKQHDALPLHGTQFLMWALRTDGQVLVIDHESVSQSVEPETDDALAYAAVAQGASAHPELAELLANNPEGVFKCLHCGGKGHVEAKPPAKGMSPCSWCGGMGWRNSAS